jgi:hypothetical protein
MNCTPIVGQSLTAGGAVFALYVERGINEGCLAFRNEGTILREME